MIDVFDFLREGRFSYILFNREVDIKELGFHMQISIWWNVYLCKRFRSVVVITTAQFHSTKPEIGFCTCLNPVRSVLGFCDGENLWQWSRQEIRLNTFRWSTIPQKKKSSSNVIIYELFLCGSRVLVIHQAG